MFALDCMRPYVKLILGIQAAGYSNVSLKTVLSLNLFKPYTFSENLIKVLPAPPPHNNLTSQVATKQN